METYIENRVNCWDTPLGQSAAKLGGILSLLEGSTTIPRGSRIKRSEAHDTLLEQSKGDDMVFSAEQFVAARHGAGEEVASSTENWFTQTVVEICPVYLAGAGGGAFGSVGTGNAVDVGQMNNGNGQIWIN